MNSWPEQELVIDWQDKHELCLPAHAIKDLSEQITRDYRLFIESINEWKRAYFGRNNGAEHTKDSEIQEAFARAFFTSCEVIDRFNKYGKNIDDYETLEFLYFTFKKLQDKTQSECVMDERRAFKVAIRNYVR